MYREGRRKVQRSISVSCSDFPHPPGMKLRIVGESGGLSRFCPGWTWRHVLFLFPLLRRLCGVRCTAIRTWLEVCRTRASSLVTQTLYFHLFLREVACRPPLSSVVVVFTSFGKCAPSSLALQGARSWPCLLLVP